MMFMKMLSIKDTLVKILTKRQTSPRRPVELTVVDQWVLKSLFLGDGAKEDSIVAMVLDERPTVIPHEVVGTLRKLELFGFIRRDKEGCCWLQPRGKKLKGVIPERPGVNLDYWG